MNELLNFLFSIEWWQWLGGSIVLAGLVYSVMNYIVPWIRQLRARHLEEEILREETEKEEELRRQRWEKEKERRKLLEQIPSGPVEKVELPPATFKARNVLHKLPLDREFVIGSDRGCNVQIARPGVLKQHAKIRPEKRGYVLYDLFSESGTLVNGRSVQSKVLFDGDRIQIGREVMEFSCPGQRKRPTPGPSSGGTGQKPAGG